jgi:hypothetical protein
MLDIVEVIVVLAKGVDTEMRMLESMSMSQMAVSSWDEIVKLVGCIGRIADNAC